MAFDKLEQQIVDGVHSHGWFGLSVAPGLESGWPQEWFTYTIGLAKTYGWPELICFGLGSKVSHTLLADAIAECLSKSVTPVDGIELLQVIEGFSAKLIDGMGIADTYFGSASWYARLTGADVPPRRLLLLWPDKERKFPDDPACDESVRRAQMPCETA